MSSSSADTPQTARVATRQGEPNEPAQAGRSLLADAWYETSRLATLLYFVVRGGIRVTGRENLPHQGGGLIVANHLSYLDVFALGVGIPRRISYVARSGLFVPVLAPLIRSVGGFPIHQRGGGGIGGLKETLRRLKAGQLVLIFPEGSRSADGRLGPLMPGVALLARAGVPFLPAGVAGTFEAFPRHRALPRAYPIHIHFGRPLPPEELAAPSAEALTETLRDRMSESLAEARLRLARVLEGPQLPASAPGEPGPWTGKGGSVSPIRPILPGGRN